jgi:thioredoxin reductase (NADPH)
MQEETNTFRPAAISEPPQIETIDWLGIGYRPDLAHPRLTEDMIERLRNYGREEVFPSLTTLYSHGERNADMFVVLEGGIDVCLPLLSGGSRLFDQHNALSFSGEINLLNSQGAVVEARTNVESRLLRIPRHEIRQLMRAEGDIANLIVQACIWRRLGIVQAASSGVVLKGNPDDAEMVRLRRFFLRNIYPHRIEEALDTETSEQDEVSVRFPEVRFSDGRILSRPTIPELADELGITELPEPDKIWDVAVVGAGPAGLAAAVYAASEGLSTVVIEGLAPGGQAGTSSKIENYLGFPTGIGGQQLAMRAQMQALKFGVHYVISRDVITIEQVNGNHNLTLAGGLSVSARSVVVATGAQYRSLKVKDCARYENRGLYYSATPMESLVCRNREVVVVGGGNSAGQASLFLSGVANHVHHIVRGSSFTSTMSQYLISRIEGSKRISVHYDSEIVGLEGTKSLRSATWATKARCEPTSMDVEAIFVMVGAEPNTGWLFGTVRLDSKGFILTGNEYGFEKSPYATSVAGIFAVGDARSTSVKRVASAVGEGSVVVSDIHRYLADQHSRSVPSSNASWAALRSVVEETAV